MERLETGLFGLVVVGVLGARDLRKMQEQE
jgi:hypothetical protein